MAALAGRSAQVVTGPTNTTGLLVLGALTPLLGANGLLRPEGLPVLATLTLLAGVLRLVAVRFGGATLLRFLPGSVLVGFTAGAGILIGAMQLDEALGLPPVAGSSLLGEAQGIAQAIGSGTSYSPEACLMALAVAASVVAGRAWLSPIPVSLIALVGASLLAGLTTPGSLPLIRDRAVMVSGWPMGAWPDLSPATLEQLFVPACAIVLLGTMELAITARARGARPDMQREMFAQGLGNLVGAFASAFPASASLTRSALLRQEGAQTRLAAAVSALLVIPVVLYGAALVELVPQAALAGVLWATAFRMVDRDAMSRLWRASGSTRLLLVVTLAATLLLPLAWAILFGAGLGLVIHLAQTSAPRLTLLQQSGGRLTRVIGDERSDYLVLEVSGDLHYAAVPPFLTEAERLLADPGRGRRHRPVPYPSGPLRGHRGHRAFGRADGGAGLEPLARRRTARRRGARRPVRKPAEHDARRNGAGAQRTQGPDRHGRGEAAARLRSRPCPSAAPTCSECHEMSSGPRSGSSKDRSGAGRSTTGSTASASAASTR